MYTYAPERERKRRARHALLINLDLCVPTIFHIEPNKYKFLAAYFVTDPALSIDFRVSFATSRPVNSAFLSMAFCKYSRAFSRIILLVISHAQMIIADC